MTATEFSSYQYDAASRITSITQSLIAERTNTVTIGTETSVIKELYPVPFTWTAAYDNRNRLTGFNRAGSEQSYTYDANSNRLTSIAKKVSDTDIDGKFENGAVTAAYGYLFNATSQAARAGWISAGAAAGGTLAAAGCTVGSGGVCALGALPVAAGGAAVGAAAGNAIADGIDKLTKAVNGNSWLSENKNTVYQLVHNVSGEVMKYGITDRADPINRYPQSFYNAFNVRMELITTFESRAPAKILEYTLCTGHMVTHGENRPAMSSRC
jgi:YD repeat-containing protein